MVLAAVELYREGGYSPSMSNLGEITICGFLKMDGKIGKWMKKGPTV